LLAQQVTKQYGEKVKFVVQDFGNSPLADRFGLDKYPALFVDDALVSRPEDFYAWGGPATGKYVPWSKPENRQRFQADLRKMLDIRLAGGTLTSLTPSRLGTAERSLPPMELSDLSGKPFRFAQLKGKPVILEFWATWCPICLETMTWLKTLDPTAASVVAVTVESDRKDVDALLQKLKPRATVLPSTPALLETFDGPPAVPTLVLADANGRIVRTFIGAPKTLHDDILAELKKLKAKG
jgi:thiol-disulfide isomerase/thioredoxin